MPDPDTQPGGVDRSQGDPGAGEPTQAPSTEPAADPTKDLAEARRALKAANREAAEFRNKLKEYEDRDKSDLDKANERAAAAEARAAALEHEQLRARICAEHGIAPEAYGRLIGTTEEEMREDAPRLAELLHATTNGSTPPPPRPDLGQGARGGVSPPSGDSWLREMARRR